MASVLGLVVFTGVMQCLKILQLRVLDPPWSFTIVLYNRL